MSHAPAYAQIQQQKMVAILRNVPTEKALPLVEALLHGGVGILEFTFDHDKPAYVEDTLKKLELVKRSFGQDVLVGCGTVLSLEELEMAADAGADLMVSPHVDPALIARARERGLVSLPGALTPTEIVSAYGAGADFVKLFPAGEFGLHYIKAIRAPLAHIPLIAVGGVTPENVGEFLAAGIAGFGVGSNLVESRALGDGQYQRITQNALAFTRAIAAWRERA